LFLNSMLQKTVQTNGGTFLPLEDNFKGADGGFALYLPDADKKLRQVRAPDGTHFTRYGYDLIAAQVVPLIEAPPAGSPAKPASAAPAVAHAQ